MDIQSSYCKRNNINSVIGSSNSFLLCDIKDSPTKRNKMICIINSYPKVDSLCFRCGIEKNLIVETYTFDKNFNFAYDRHSHINAGECIINSIKNFFLLEKSDFIKFRYKKNICNFVNFISFFSEKKDEFNQMLLTFNETQLWNLVKFYENYNIENRVYLLVE